MTSIFPMIFLICCLFSSLLYLKLSSSFGNTYSLWFGSLLQFFLLQFQGSSLLYFLLLILIFFFYFLKMMFHVAVDATFLMVWFSHISVDATFPLIFLRIFYFLEKHLYCWISFNYPRLIVTGKYNIVSDRIIYVNLIFIHLLIFLSTNLLLTTHCCLCFFAAK